MFAANLCYGTLSAPGQNEVMAVLSLLLTLNMSHLLVFPLLTLNMIEIVHGDYSGVIAPGRNVLGKCHRGKLSMRECSDTAVTLDYLNSHVDYFH